MPDAISHRFRFDLVRLMASAAVFCALSRSPLIAAAQPPDAVGAMTLSETERKALLEERDRLGKSALALSARGNVAEAVGVAEKMLAIELRVFGPVHDEVASSWRWLVSAYLQEGDFTRARKAAEQALFISGKLHGESDWRTSDARRALAEVDRRSRLTQQDSQELVAAERMSSQAEGLYQKGSSREAFALMQNVLGVRQRILGSEHPDTATSLFDLAVLYVSSGEYAKAEPLHREALAIRRKVLGDQHPDTATSFNNLGLVYHSLGQYAQAEANYQSALALRLKLLGENDADTAFTLGSLGALYRDLGDHAKAEPLLVRAYQTCLKVQGESDDRTISALNALASLYKSEGKYSKAEPLFSKTVNLYRKRDGDEHPNTARALHYLGVLEINMAHYARAEELLGRALAIRKKTLGDQHPDTADSMTELAHVYYTLGANAKAEPLFLAALAVEQKTLGPSHESTAATMNDLAMLYEATGSYGKAQSLLQQAVAIYQKIVGPQHPYLANVLDNLGLVERDLGNLNAAQRHYLQALEIQKLKLGEQHPRTAHTLLSLGLLHMAKAEYSQARDELTRALETFRAVDGDQHPDTAGALASLASLDQEMGQFDSAQSLYDKCLAVRKAVFGDEHAETANTLSDLGRLYQARADYPQAEAYLRESLRILRKVRGERHVDTGAALHNLAHLYDATGDFSNAESLFRQALEIRREALGKNHPEVAKTLHGLGLAAMEVGDYDNAQSWLTEALDIDRKNLGERHPDTATSLENLGSLYRERGDYAKAEPLCRQALEILTEKFGDSPRTALGLSNLGILYSEMRDYERAELFTQRALEIKKKILGPRHPDTAISLGNLAEVYLARHQYAKARPLFEEALAVNTAVFGRRHLRTAHNLNDLGEICLEMHEYSKAEELLREAVDVRRALRGQDHPETALAIMNLAAVTEHIDSARAAALCTEALESQRRTLPDGHPQTALTLNNLALLYDKAGDFSKAEPMEAEALATIQRILVRTFGILSERQQLEFQSLAHEYLSNYLSVASRSNAPDDAVYRAVFATKGIVTAGQSVARLQRRRPELRSLFTRLQSVGTQLANLAFVVPQTGRRTDWLKQVEDLTNQKEKLEGELASKSREFGETQAVLRLTSDKLQQSLPPDTALVDVLEYGFLIPSARDRADYTVENRLLAFVIRPDRAVRKIDLGPLAAVTRAVEEWRRSLEGQATSHAGDVLRSLIWQPLVPLLNGADTVLVSNDGPLSQVPIAALPGSKPQSYLIEERRIAVVPVPRLLPQLLANRRPGDSPASAPLLIGDIDFDADPRSNGDSGSRLPNQTGLLAELEPRTAVRGTSQNSTHFSMLPGTRREIEQIRALSEKHFGDRRPLVLTGQSATEQVFRTEAPKHRWIHIATHGFFAPESVASALEKADAQDRPVEGLFARPDQVRGFHPGLLSGIVLAGANRPPAAFPTRADSKPQDDGILTAVEVEGLDLTDVDLVVLSACETGLGRVAGGEGVLGLQRAFQVAGAKTAITSLWKVDDEATQVLMREFYSNLWGKKLGKYESLRQAQLRMLREYDPHAKKLVARGLDLPEGNDRGPGRGSPFYWAAFVLSGDWR